MNFIYPIAVMIFYILAIGIVNFRTRLKGWKTGAFNVGYFKHMDHKAFDVPEYVVRVARHFDNQFQVPPLFMITCLACAVMHLQSTAAVILAWLFIATRLGHSFYHLGSNHVLKRAGFYFAGWGCLIAQWGVLLAHSS